MGKTGRKVPLALLDLKEKRVTKATRVFLANSAPLVPQDRMEQTGRSVPLDLLAQLVLLAREEKKVMMVRALPFLAVTQAKNF